MKPAPFKILKLLPGTNCRDCGFETCLALATYLYAYGPAELKKCPRIDQENVTKISNMFGPEEGDKRGTMIQLWEEFRKGLKDVDIESLKKLEGFYSGSSENSVCFNFIGDKVCVTTMDISSEGNLLDEHTKILIYYYVKCAVKLNGAFDFCDYRSFYSKLNVRDVNQEEFEIRIQNAVKNDTDSLAKTLKKLGGVEYAAYKDLYDISVMVLIFPFVPVLLLYRPGDEEFPPYCKFMFDKGCGICFDAEGLEHLSEALADRISRHLTG
jgi:hypothetical protein